MFVEKASLPQPGDRDMNLPIVGVVASGTESNEPEHGRKAQEIGEWLASEGVHLLTGGGGGLMMAVSRAFYEQPNRRGLVIGVLPCVKDDPKTPKKIIPTSGLKSQFSLTFL